MIPKRECLCVCLCAEIVYIRKFYIRRHLIFFVCVDSRRKRTIEQRQSTDKSDDHDRSQGTIIPPGKYRFSFELYNVNLRCREAFRFYSGN